MMPEPAHIISLEHVIEAPTVEAPRAHTPIIETPAAETLTAEAPGVETPRIEIPMALQLEALLNTSVINYAQAAYFVLSSALDASSGVYGITQDTAFEYALENGWFSEKAAMEEPIKLNALSFLLMKSFNMKGGLLYRFFPDPRYAYRECAGMVLGLERRIYRRK